MATPVLVTKLYIPPSRPGVVARRRLIEQLDEGLHRKLTLVSAPAGFGKTTLISEWIAGCGRPTAWLSLDDSDNDLSRFLTYLIAALQTVGPAIGEGVSNVLNLPQLPPTESILTALLNDLSELATPVVLVLDDYHLIDSQPIDDAVAFLLNHLPPQAHIVITTREDPRLPLARLRARGEMTELRAADLRFTAGEAAAFLNDAMGLGLSESDVAALETRTEGWIAGLQLAALSMRGRDDLSGFVRAFAGDDRYIVDYLAEEVLRRQPEHIRTFLVETSLLDRLSGSLCDAVTDRDDSKDVLASLERANLFVMPLDDKRQWYRYHHLFADALRAHALEEGPYLVASRHRQASEWFEHNGSSSDAVRHALAAGDIGRAADLVERAALSMLGSSQEDMLYGWLKAIPDDVVRTRPVLSVYYGFASFGREGLDAAEARFQGAERWLEVHGNVQPVGVNVEHEAALRSLPGTIAVGRAYRAGALGDVEGIVRSARQALDVMPESDDLWSGAASAVLGIGLWTNGNLEPAYRSFDQGKMRLERAGYMQFQIVSVHILADIRLAQGQLREAERIYRQSLELATEQGDPLWGTVDLLVGLSEMLLEQNDLATAIQYLHRSKELGDHAGLMDTRHRWFIAMAHIREAEGNFDAALDLLDEAARQQIPGADPDLRPIAALKARVWIAQGRLDEAISWAHRRDLAVDDDLSYLREFEHITLVRTLIACYRRDRDDRVINDAAGLLDRLLKAAEAGERAGSVIEILVLQALTHEARGNVPNALEPLGRALSLAGPEGYIRVFTGEGEPMARLLMEANGHGMLPHYTGSLLAAVQAEELRRSPVSRTMTDPHADLLSQRELEVMHLIAQGFSNKVISETLFVALDTVKGHNRRIFGKLEVQSRTEAIARARDLGLLES